MIKPDLELYRQEKEEWKSQGKPTRSDERVAELHAICAPCDQYIKIPLVEDRGQCAVCSCLLSKDGDYMNKLRWATTKCPLDKWKEEEGYEKEAEPEVPAQPQFNSRAKKTNTDCGCG